MAITPLPTPPSRSDATNFASRGDTFMAALPTFVTEANATATAMDAALQTSMMGVTATSSTSLTIGTGSKTMAVESGKGFVAGMYLLIASSADTSNYMKGTVTSYAGSTLTVNVDSVAGSGTIDSWSISITPLPSTAPTPIKTSSRISNTTLGLSDFGTLIDITSGTFTQTLDAAATLGDGWWCYIRNSGTGDITLDPDESETIDGLTSYILYPYEVRLITCNGSSFTTVLLHGGQKIFLSSGTFTRPPGVHSAKVFLMSAGGGGSSGSAVTANYVGYTNYAAAAPAGSGGGSGFAVLLPYMFPTENYGDSITVTVGAGGTGGTAVTKTSGQAGNGVAGSTGGSTVFGTMPAVLGGSGGSGPSAYLTAGSATFYPGTGGAGGYMSGYSAACSINTVGTIGGSLGALFDAAFIYPPASVPSISATTYPYSCYTGGGRGSANGTTMVGGTVTPTSAYPSGGSLFYGKSAACYYAYNYFDTSVAGFSLARNGGVAGGFGTWGYNGTTLVTQGTQNTAGAAGANATGYGGGGNGGQAACYNNGGTAVSGKGGDGAPGFVVVWWEV